MEMHVGDAGWRNEAFQEDNKGKMLVIFRTEQVKDNFQTAQQKRPVYRPRVFIKKLIPGDSRLVIDRPMRDTDMEEFPVEWARFEQKKANIIPGTPIDAWTELTDTQKAEFKALNIFTVDQFANLNESSADKIMGFYELRTKARAFVLAGKDSEAMSKQKAELEAQLAERDQRMAAQDEEMRKLREMIENMGRKKPGRKPREQVAA